MARPARPSDVYRLPDEAPPRPWDGGDEEPVQGPRRRFPAWVGVAGVLAAILVASGLIGSSAAPTTGDAPLVDIVSEDQAIAALALYGAQARTIDKLREQLDILSIPGPGAAAGVAGRGAAEVQRTLDAARAVRSPDTLYSLYVGHGDHAQTHLSLSNVSTTAETIALLSATHDSIYSGTGSIAANEAYERIGAAVSGGRSPGALHTWGVALLEQMENRPAANAALQGRQQTEEYWRAVVEGLEPAAVAELQTYVTGLPAQTVEALRGHPVAGPALQRLEETSRQISAP